MARKVGGTGSQKKNRDHRDHSIAKIGSFFWPYPALISSRPHLTLLLLLRQWVLNRRPALGSSVGSCPSWELLKTHTDRLPLSVGIYIYHFKTLTHFHLITWLLPLFFPQVRPVQRISDWRLGQGSICNKEWFISWDILGRALKFILGDYSRSEIVLILWFINLFPLLLFFASFSHQRWLVIFLWNLSDSKSPCLQDSSQYSGRLFLLSKLFLEYFGQISEVPNISKKSCMMFVFLIV